MRRIRFSYDNRYYGRYQPMVCRRLNADPSATAGWHVGLQGFDIVAGSGEVLGSNEVRIGGSYPNDRVCLCAEEADSGVVSIRINDNPPFEIYFDPSVLSESSLHFGFDPQQPRFSFESGFSVDENEECLYDEDE